MLREFFLKKSENYVLFTLLHTFMQAEIKLLAPEGFILLCELPVFIFVKIRWALSISFAPVSFLRREALHTGILQGLSIFYDDCILQ